MSDEDFNGFQEEEDSLKPIEVAPQPKKPAAKPAAGPKSRSQAMDPQEWLELQQRREERQRRDDAEKAARAELDQLVPEQLRKEAEIVEKRKNLLKAGEYCDILATDPTLRKITIGAGWDQRQIDEPPADVDISVFLLDKKEQTRIDEDFIFYNNTTGCDGAIQHMGDSRTGAGDGDDETVFIDLNALPYDVAKLMFVFTIYDEELKGYKFNRISNLFIRVVNKEDGSEIVRYPIEEDRMHDDVIFGAVLIREGPRWIFEALGKTMNGGLASVAKDYGLIIRELQSTGVRTSSDFT
jgi:tellurium resistance protein TerD